MFNRRKRKQEKIRRKKIALRQRDDARKAKLESAAKEKQSKAMHRKIVKLIWDEGEKDLKLAQKQPQKALLNFRRLAMHYKVKTGAPTLAKAVWQYSWFALNACDGAQPDYELMDLDRFHQLMKYHRAHPSIYFVHYGMKTNYQIIPVTKKETLVIIADNMHEVKNS